MIEFTQKNIIDVCFGTKTIKAGYFGTTLVYQKSSPGPSTDPYITFTANAPSTIGLSKKSSVHTLEYSTNKKNWNTMDTTTSISLSSGDKLYVRGILSANNSSSDYTRFSITGNVSALGNINSLWNYQNLTASLKQRCGYRMFYGCKGLTTVGSLPATTLASSCYEYMFDGCTALTTAPELPATTLASDCYSHMFQGCTSLTTAPIINCSTINSDIAESMFSGCSSLIYVKCLSAYNTDSDGVKNWMYGTNSSGTFVKNANALFTWRRDDSGIPSGWTVQNA